MPSKSEVTKLVDEILASANAAGSRELAAWQHPQRDIRRLARRDYAPSLRKRLGRNELRDVLRAARRVFPELNRDHSPWLINQWVGEAQPIWLANLFSSISEKLGVHFQSTPFRGPEGLALRGFFVNRHQASLKRPLIYVNTAHHPVAAAATFFHEVGHFLAAELFVDTDEGVHFFFDADYASHLDDLEELTADIVLSLIAYPAPVAKKIFNTPWKWDALANLNPLTDEVFAQVGEHFRVRFGVILSSADLPPRRKLNYLAGMIHFAKLRGTLLAEYGI
ncbi:MAG TPA: hypothetical protein VN867_11785 [Candidatus Binataceae bacterium]|nr:hypothetical protein [Candidatus Binataceae bacterium]